MAIMPRALQEQTIRQDLIRVGLDPQTIDVHALVDGTLSLPENRRNIARKLKYSVGVKAGVREQKKKVDTQYCGWLREKCEVNGDKESCKAYGRDKCAPVTGKIEGCKVCSAKAKAAPVGKKAPTPASSNAQIRNGNCMISVAAHWRHCPPKTVARLGGMRSDRK